MCAYGASTHATTSEVQPRNVRGSFSVKSLFREENRLAPPACGSYYVPVPTPGGSIGMEIRTGKVGGDVLNLDMLRDVDQRYARIPVFFTLSAVSLLQDIISFPLGIFFPLQRSTSYPQGPLLFLQQHCAAPVRRNHVYCASNGTMHRLFGTTINTRTF